MFSPFEHAILSAHDALSHFIYNFNPMVVLRELQHEEENVPRVEESVSTDEEDIEANLEEGDLALSNISAQIDSSTSKS